jgi:hypothetical protein
MPSGRVSPHPCGRNAGVGRSHSSGDGDGVIDCNLRARNMCSRSARSRAAVRSTEDTPLENTVLNIQHLLLITTEEGFCWAAQAQEAFDDVM